MKRIPEPDLMESQEQALSYANADFSDSNNLFLNKVFQCSNISENTTLLDVGCGDGEIPIKIRSAKKCNITALDGSESMLKEFKKKLDKQNIEDITVIHQRLEENSFNDESFDIITSNSVLHHVVSPHQYWDELIRLVKSTGTIFIMDLVRPKDEVALTYILDKYGGNDPTLRNDFDNSLRAAYTLPEVTEQLSVFYSISFDAKLISDRHFFVTIESKR